MTAPFAIRTTPDSPGLVWVDKAKDEAFRKALLDGIPVSLRAKMKGALSIIPDKGALAHSQRYFGAELPMITGRTAPLIFALNRYLTEQLQLPGLYDWLNVTGYGNDYRMIKAFDAWAQLPLRKPKLIVNG